MAEPPVQPPSRLSATFLEVLATIREGDLVLDVGCGGGAQMRAMPRSVGIDFSPENVAACRALGCDVVQGDVESGLPFDDARFDVVVMSHLLEHVQRPLDLLGEARRVMVRQGRLFVGVPLEKSVFRVVARDPYFSGHSGHLFSYTSSGLSVLLSRAGFTLVGIRHDIPLARRLGAPFFQRIGNSLLPDWVLDACAANVWAVGIRP